MLCFHHLFGYSKYYQDFYVDFSPFAEHHVQSVALMCKICVSIFAFISGYGLFLDNIKQDVSMQKWTYRRYVKTFSGFWFGWIFCNIICTIINRLPLTRYFCDGTLSGLLYMLLDFGGLASLFATPTLNGAWWYMSAAFVFILITPIIVKHKDELLWFLALLIVFPRVMFAGNTEDPYTGQNSVYAFLGAFLMGCIFARYQLFDKICSTRHKFLRFLLELFVSVISFRAYHILSDSKFWEIRFAIIPTIVIIFLVEYILVIPALAKVFSYIGKHSMNIYMTHTLISGRYLRSFIYSFEHWVIILIVLVFVSLALSIAIEETKKITRYNLFISKLLSNNIN